MKKTSIAFLAIAAALWLNVQSTSAAEKERSVAFKTADGKYITTATGSLLDLSGAKIGSKQTFTLIDVNGEDLADGDEVKIRYTPNSPTGPDLTKANYWHDAKGELKRGHDADVFKVKKVDSKYAFQSAAGKFVGVAAGAATLTFVDTQDSALLVEIVDVPVAAAKKTDKAAEDKPAAD